MVKQELYLVIQDGVAVVAYPAEKSIETYTKYFKGQHKVAIIKGVFKETEVVKDIERE